MFILAKPQSENDHANTAAAQTHVTLQSKPFNEEKINSLGIGV